eukprot:3403236-Rhodomonas_salina.4
MVATLRPYGSSSIASSGPITSSSCTWEQKQHRSAPHIALGFLVPFTSLCCFSRFPSLSRSLTHRLRHSDTQTQTHLEHELFVVGSAGREAFEEGEREPHLLHLPTSPHIPTVSPPIRGLRRHTMTRLTWAAGMFST